MLFQVMGVVGDFLEFCGRDSECGSGEVMPIPSVTGDALSEVCR